MPRSLTHHSLPKGPLPRWLQIARPSVTGWIVLLALLGSTQALSAHELTEGVGTQTTFLAFSDRLELEVNLGFSASAGFPVLMALDVDRDDRISAEEAQVLLDERGASLLPFLDVRVNGRRLDLRVISSEEVGIRGSISVKSFDLYFTVVANMPPELPTGGYWLHFVDRSFEGETATQISWFPYSGHGEGISFQTTTPWTDGDIGYQRTARDLTLRFAFDYIPPDPQLVAPTVDALAAIPLAGESTAPSDGEIDRSASPGTSQIPRTAGPVQEGAGEEELGEEEEIGGVMSRLAKGEIAGWELILTLLLAVVYGAGHALGPGHGKSMVAAYLVGSKGRIRDAITLGAVVTFAHTFSIFLLGLLLLYLIEQAADRASGATYQNWITTSFSLLSGLLLFTFGLVLFRRRLRVARGRADPHDHHHHGGLFGHSHPHLGGAHGHSHDHSHGHSHAPGDQGHSHDHDHDHSDGQDHGHTHEAEEGAGHSHDHGHAHDHEDPQPGAADGVRFRDLVTLGLSGGIVPCPAGFTIMLVAAHYQRLSLGLLYLTFFSLGLGAVLCAIGVVLVVAKDGVLNLFGSKSDLLLRWLPVGSACLVGAIGVYFVWDSVSQGRTEISQMLTALARQIGG